MMFVFVTYFTGGFSSHLFFGLLKYKNLFLITSVTVDILARVTVASR